MSYVRGSDTRLDRTFGFELIHVVLSPSTSPEPAQYQLHANKLRDASEYFAGLVRFPGIEKQSNKVTLSEGYEGLEDAFETFVEWLYTGSLVCEGVLAQARLIVLTERLVAKELKGQVLTLLDKNLKATNLRLPIKDAVQLIRVIYQGTHRPYSSAASGSASSTLADHTILAPTGVNSNIPPKASPRRQYNSTTRYGYHGNPSVYSTATIIIPPADANPQEVEAFNHRNCKARKIVAEFAAGSFRILRECKSFRKLVEEVGEFASDLLMENLGSGNQAVNVEIVDFKV